MGILKDKLVAIVLTLIIMVGGSILYFALDPDSKMSGMNGNVAKLYGNIEFKVAFAETGDMKVFAHVSNNGLSKFKVSEGSNGLSQGMVIGSAEASMMKEELLIEGIDSELNSFFGINTKVIGILEKTDTFIDDTHFLNKEQFSLLDGYENLLLMKLTDNNEPKLFFLLDKGDNYPFMKFISTEIVDVYAFNNINSEYYYPVILGFAEAEMMIEEKLITGEGDVLRDFFGRDVIIVGILPKTNTAVDMMHFVPKNFFEKGVLV